jgi:hypothetical protein
MGVPTSQHNGALLIPATPSPGDTSDPGLVTALQDEPAVSPSAPEDRARAVEGVEPLSTAQKNRQQARQAQRDNTRMRERLALHCPRCSKSFVQRSHRRGVKERLLSLIYIYPFRCQVCGHRFKAFRFRVRYAKQLLDRRQYERLPTHVLTTFSESVRPGQYRVGQGVVTDISLGGCYLQTVARCLEGAVLSMELQTVDHAPAIVVEAAIVRSVRPTGMGLEFLRLHESDQERLREFMRQLLTERYATAPEAQNT